MGKITTNINKDEILPKDNPVQETEQEEPDHPVDILPKKELLRIDEVANHLRVTDRTVRLWIEHGYFEVEKIGGSIRVLKSSVLNFRLRSRIKA